MDDALRTPDDTQGSALPSIIVRRTADGSEHLLVKVPYTSAYLQDRLAVLGWCVLMPEVADALF